MQGMVVNVLGDGKMIIFSSNRSTNMCKGNYKQYLLMLYHLQKLYHRDKVGRH